MAARTLEELSEDIDERLAWRKKEISTLALHVETAGNDTQPILIRAGVAMLYAHWEGCVKEVAKAYLGFVAVRRLPPKELVPALRGLVYRRHLAGRIMGDATNLAEAVDELVGGQSNPCDLPQENVINTESNLSHRVLCSILDVLALPKDHYGGRRALIDEKLLARRNGIAHGEDEGTDLAGFRELKAAVVDLIDGFCVEVFMAASGADYRMKVTA